MDFHRNPGDSPLNRGRMILILVVDDDADTVDSLQAVLSMLGFEAVTARNAQEALRRVEERLPDLIITDCEMPLMNGLELCRLLRSRVRTRDIPLVVYTAGDLPEDRPRVYDRAIAKTADMAAILGVIRALLDRAGHVSPSSRNI